MEEHYYSIEQYELKELLSFLRDCGRRYKNLNLKVASSFTNLWIISNKDLYAPLQGEFKYKYRTLKTKLTPQKRWKITWVDYKVKIKRLEKILGDRWQQH